MIIDEDPTSLFFVAKLLETCHYKVEPFENPVDALNVLYERQEEYDLVIMDLDCINMHGFDLLDIIARKMNIPVTTTCYDDSEKIRKQALFSGACCHIVKPITVKKLEFVWMKEWRFSVKRKESKKQQNRKGRVDFSSNTMSADDLDSNKNSKTRLHWDEKLHVRFLVAVSLLGVEANSKSIMGIMNVEGLTGKEVSSHLQNHKLRLQKEKLSNFSPPIFPLHQFPTGVKHGFSMPNRESNPMVIEDKEDWTTDALSGSNEAAEVVQHDHQMVDSSNSVEFLSEFLDFNFESNNFLGESEAVRHDHQTVNSSNGSVVNFDFISEFLGFNFESNNVMGESEAVQHHRRMIHSLNGSEIDFKIVPEFLNINFETNKLMDECEAAQHDEQMLDSSNDFDFESNRFMDESKAAPEGKDDSPNDFDFVPEFLEFDFEKATFLDDI